VHIIALANEQCSCDGAINSTAHTEEDGWASHWGSIVLGGVGKGLEVCSPDLAAMNRQIVNVVG
jgi:hypothetical protein